MLKIKSIKFYHDPDITNVQYDKDNDDEEVCVTLEDGRSFYCWFFTLEKISSIMKRHRLSGEFNGGSYFWATNMIIIESLTKSIIKQNLVSLIEQENDLSAFEQLFFDSKTQSENF